MFYILQIFLQDSTKNEPSRWRNFSTCAIVKCRTGGGRVMSNYGIFRIKKYDGGAVRGIEKHVQREASSSRTNPDIDYARSSKNYNLHNRYQGTYKQAIEKRLRECGIEKVRKNGVQMVELLFTASHDFFKDKTDDEIRQYFQDCYNWACSKYGIENIITAQVHLDEYTPHMHLEFIPICRNKLNARELFKRPLTEIQNEVYKNVFKNYGLERGESIEQKRQHISTLNFKIITLQQEIDNKRHELSVLQNELDNNELYQLRANLKSMQDKLSKMFDVLESDPQLMQEYKQAIAKLKEERER